MAIRYFFFGLICFLYAWTAFSEEPPEKRLPELIKQLGDNDWGKRSAADEALTRLGKDLIAQYKTLKLANKKDPGLEALKTRLAPLVNALREAMKDKDVEIKIRAAKIYQELKDLTMDRIIFFSDRRNKGGGGDFDLSSYLDLYIIDEEGENERILTGDSGFYYDMASWSPDGSRVLFVKFVAVAAGAGFAKRICVMDPDGKEYRELTAGPNHTMPVWSPDGTKIVFEEKLIDKHYYLMSIDSNGKNKQQLTKNKEYDHSEDTRWTPDSKKILFTGSNGKNPGLYIIDADGQNERRLIGQNERGLFKDAEYFDLSPDGKQIVFRAMGKETPGIYVMPASPSGGDIDGKDVRRLTKNEIPSAGAPKWNPDGKKIAFLRGVDENGENYALCLMDADGKNQKILTNRIASSITWNPDGTKIVFESGGLKKREIYIIDTDGKNEQKLTENPADNWGPVWCPFSLSDLAALFTLRSDTDKKK